MNMNNSTSDLKLSWYVNVNMNENYFPNPNSLSNFCADTNVLIAPQNKCIFGVKLRQKVGNLLAPEIYCAYKDGSEGEWIKNDQKNENFFPKIGGLSSIYVDTNPLLVPDGKVWSGFKLISKENRIAASIFCTNKDGSEGAWIENSQMNYHYFPKEGGLDVIYSDSNPIVTKLDPVGFKFYEKNNRIAPMLLASDTTSGKNVQAVKSDLSMRSIPFYAVYAQLVYDALINRWFSEDFSLLCGHYPNWSLDSWTRCVASEFILGYLEITETNSLIYKGLSPEEIVKTIIGKNGCLSLSGTDDWLWYIITNLKAYAKFNNKDYLDEAVKRFEDKVDPYWDDTCKGGIWWDEKRGYKNAISNELYLYATTELYLLTHESSYLEKAQKEWDWFRESGLINKLNLINNGLDKCQNNNQECWTYNQGVILGGLVNLWRITKDTTYMQKAYELADGVYNSKISNKDQLVSDNGILLEAKQSSLNSDQQMFKGIYMHYLAYYVEYEVDENKKSKFRNFILDNAKYVKENAQNADGLIDAYWDKGISSLSLFSSEAQVSALGLFNAAARVEK
jgi:predicted alpha-1,6-mannanase (GH76 family)